MSMRAWITTSIQLSSLGCNTAIESVAARVNSPSSCMGFRRRDATYSQGNIDPEDSHSQYETRCSTEKDIGDIYRI
jgi:hypothetical protein